MAATITSIRQTPILKDQDGVLREKLVINIDSPSNQTAALLMDKKLIWTGELTDEDNAIDAWIDEPLVQTDATFVLNASGASTYYPQTLHAPKHWEIHAVQTSHHDPGYTDVPSHVIDEMATLIEDALDIMRTRDDYPYESRPRIVIEQAWSLCHFFKTSTDAYKKEMIARIQSGDVEVTAFFANQISEIMGHEEFIRAMYPSSEIARLTGVPLRSVDHNDVPGFTWGFCKALLDAGIKIFLPHVPFWYYDCDPILTPQLDKSCVMQGNFNISPFWWECQDGRKLFVLMNNGYNTPYFSDKAVAYAEKLEADGWPHDVLYLSVGGGERDNAPYSAAYADDYKAWNEQYAYPRLIVSTNTLFYESFMRRLAHPLPILRGEFPGQDYPVLSMSQPTSEAISRETHGLLRSAEILSVFASPDPLFCGYHNKLAAAYRDVCMADEHVYGHFQVASSAHRASYWEHGVYAARAHADADDILKKAMASIADRVVKDGDAPIMTVFNLSGLGGDKVVDTPLRELESSNLEMFPRAQTPWMGSATLLNRMPLEPKNSLLEGKFGLIDIETQEEVPFELHSISYDDPAPFASERSSRARAKRWMATETKTLGYMLNLRFLAKNMPAFGYRCYKLRENRDVIAAAVTAPELRFIENEFYRIDVDDQGVCAIVDKRDGFDMLDVACPHRLGQVLVRNENDMTYEDMHIAALTLTRSEIQSSIDIHANVSGVFGLRIRIQLFSGVDQIMLNVRFIKDAQPLQTVYLAFPFAGEGMRYQGVLNELTPVRDYLPGSQSDAISVQDWVHINGSDIIWHAVNAPIVSMSHLWSGYVSAAHRGKMAYEPHPANKLEDYDTGGLYSMLSYGNTGTNFFPTQVGDCAFTYRFSRDRLPNDTQRALWGTDAAAQTYTTLSSVGRGTLPIVNSFVDVGEMHLLTVKCAEDANGIILRLWNHLPHSVPMRINIPGISINKVVVCDMLENDMHSLPDGYAISAYAVATIRVLGSNKQED